MPRELVALPRGDDLAHCRTLLAQGSKGFAIASRLLPRRVRASATVFYAFCRVADDAVDLAVDPIAGVQQVRARVDAMYAGVAVDDPVDRAMARLVAEHRLPRSVIDALVEGLAWDAEGRSYDSFSELLEYCMRVASAVGVAMSVLMDVRDSVALARACDLGAAMQLTNIARDVGEDARRGRLYLPRHWLVGEGVDPAQFLADPTASKGVRTATRRLLAEAEPLYRRGQAGLSMLPPDCRASIRAAARIYADIGRVIRRRGYDSVSGRAVVSTPRKLWLAFVAALGSGAHDAAWRRYSALPQARFLIEAAEAP